MTDQELSRCHWTKEAMLSPAARTAWVEPDMVPLP